MKQSRLKITIEYQTQGMNVKEEHFITGAAASTCFVGVKSTIKSSLNQKSVEESAKPIKDSPQRNKSFEINTLTKLACIWCDFTTTDWWRATQHVMEHDEHMRPEEKILPGEDIISEKVTTLIRSSFIGPVDGLLAKHCVIHGLFTEEEMENINAEGE